MFIHILMNLDLYTFSPTVFVVWVSRSLDLLRKREKPKEKKKMSATTLASG